MSVNKKGYLIKNNKIFDCIIRLGEDSIKNESDYMINYRDRIKKVSGKYLAIDINEADKKLKKFRKRRKIKELKIKKKVKREKDWICFWCGKHISYKEDCTVDHIMPISSHLPWEKLWNINNLEICCRKCNYEKDNKRPKTYQKIINISEKRKKRYNKPTNKKIVGFGGDYGEKVMEIAKKDSRYLNVEYIINKKHYNKKIHNKFKKVI